MNNAQLLQHEQQPQQPQRQRAVTDYGLKRLQPADAAVYGPQQKRDMYPRHAMISRMFSFFFFCAHFRRSRVFLSFVFLLVFFSFFSSRFFPVVSVYFFFAVSLFVFVCIRCPPALLLLFFSCFRRAKVSSGRFGPNVDSRLFWEDIPFGLCILKNLAGKVAHRLFDLAV